jgi:hypothetical protein
MRKTLTVEADESKVEMIQYWVETAKNRKIFQRFWGNKVRVTAVLDNRGKRKGGHQTQMKVDMAAMASYARKHVNYHSSTRMDGLKGILHLDKPVEFYSVTDPTKVMGKITLRKILYKYIKMSDEHGLFEEVHQAKPLHPVDVVVPNCEEAERMLLMMQKNTAAYYWFYLKEETNLGEQLIANVIRASMDPILVNGIDKCVYGIKSTGFCLPQRTLKTRKSKQWRRPRGIMMNLGSTWWILVGKRSGSMRMRRLLRSCMVIIHTSQFIRRKETMWVLLGNSLFRSGERKSHWR